MVEGSGVPDSVGLGAGSTVGDSDGLGDGGCGGSCAGGVGLCDGAVGLGDGFVVVPGAFVGVLPGLFVVLLGFGLAGVDEDDADDGCLAADGADHGGFGESGVAEGCVDGNQVARGVERFRAGTPGRCPDRVTPAVRSAFGSRDVLLQNESALFGGCLVAESGAPNGTKNNDAAPATATAATALTFRTGRRPRLCRGPDFCRCRPRL